MIIIHSFYSLCVPASPKTTSSSSSVKTLKLLLFKGKNKPCILLKVYGISFHTVMPFCWPVATTATALLLLLLASFHNFWFFGKELHTYHNIMYVSSIPHSLCGRAFPLSLSLFFFLFLSRSLSFQKFTLYIMQRTSMRCGACTHKIYTVHMY